MGLAVGFPRQWKCCFFRIAHKNVSYDSWECGFFLSVFGEIFSRSVLACFIYSYRP